MEKQRKLHANQRAQGNKAEQVAAIREEQYDSAFFSALVSAKQPFVTWDKNVDTTRLETIAEERFTSDFQFNGKRYSVLEEEKAFCHTPPGAASQRFTLRYLIIWNHASNRRTAGLAYGDPHALSTEEATRAILSRWGAKVSVRFCHDRRLECAQTDDRLVTREL